MIFGTDLQVYSTTIKFRLNMKKFFFFSIFSSALAFGANAQVITPVPVQEAPGTGVTPVDPANAATAIPVTTIEFAELNHSFGDVKQGEMAVNIYKFKNTGSNPAVIESVKPGCGCTASDYSKEPIPPGGEGYVKLEFNSAFKQGAQSKIATVVYNGDPKVITLSFNCNVVVPPPPPGEGTPSPAPEGH